jgi:hypothetical protein
LVEDQAFRQDLVRDTVPQRKIDAFSARTHTHTHKYIQDTSRVRVNALQTYAYIHPCLVILDTDYIEVEQYFRCLHTHIYTYIRTYGLIYMKLVAVKDGKYA